MPSPFGHALGGAAAGWALTRPTTGSHSAGQLWRRGAVFALLGMVPDLDLLTRIHRGPSHSLTAAALVGIVVLLVTRQGRLALAAAAAYGSHILLDWLGSDTSPPVGIMALWPFTRDYYQSHIQVFAATRRYLVPDFWPQNLRAVGWEILILLPLAWAGRALALRRAMRD